MHGPALDQGPLHRERCRAHSDTILFASVSFATNAAGHADVPAPIPAAVGLLGFSLATPAGVLDPSGSFAGAAFTGSLFLRLGH
ncbi:MAG: hypothetical protein AAF628_19510 [Planctomycetota bacterium]